MESPTPNEAPCVPRPANYECAVSLVVVQGHPKDLIDPYWINETVARGYREILYKEWSLDLDDVEPAYVDEHLPDGVTLVRRGTMLTSRRIECVLQSAGALAAVELARRRCWIGVAGRDLPSAERLLAAVERAFPAPPLPTIMDEPHINVTVWTRSNDSRASRRLDASTWEEIANNYETTTRKDIAPVTEPDHKPNSGQLIVWHGAPGTGKSFALAALAFARREWASFSYIADPEVMLGDAAYLFEWMTMRHPLGLWRVAILEDTGELFGADAARRTGQGFARLLNASDGLMGRGSKTLFIITTTSPSRASTRPSFALPAGVHHARVRRPTGRAGESMAQRRWSVKG